MNATAQVQARPAPRPSVTPVGSDLLQRKCACGGTPGPSGECAECRKKRLQRRSKGQAGPSSVPPVVHDVLRSPGRPLDAATRAFMEPRFGHDFGGVRVHADARATASARAVNALAYTVGQDVVFGAGQYAPETGAGRRLLAHELAHTVQQHGTTGPAQGTGRDFAAQTMEREAEAQASRVASGRAAEPAQLQAKIGTARLQRLGDPTQAPAGMACPLAPDSPMGGGGTVMFGKAARTLTPGLQAGIAAFVGSWQASGANADVRVDGYASAEGTQAFNWQLSCDRALAVAREMITPSGSGAGPGIPSSFITVFAQGETTEFSATTPDPNRRAVISVTFPAPVPAPPAVPSCTTPTNPDQSGSAFNPTTAGEIEVASTNPFDAWQANSAADGSFAAARASGLPGAYLGPQDAFRHCIWNCFMAQRIGASEAEKFGTGHENSGPSAVPFDNQMDLHNNSVGRSLGGPGADCAAACASAVASGQLRTIRGPQTRPPSPVTTPCIGPSNQPWP